MNYTSKPRREAIQTAQENARYRPASRHARVIREFGVDREADFDMLLAAKARITADLNLTRWNHDEDVKAAVKDARDALDRALTAVNAVRKAAGARVEARMAEEAILRSELGVADPVGASR